MGVPLYLLTNRLTYPILLLMKKILLALCMVLFLGCSKSYNSTPFREIANLEGKSIWSANIDGCEYLFRGVAFTHKGNCTNMIHYVVFSIPVKKEETRNQRFY